MTVLLRERWDHHEATPALLWFNRLGEGAIDGPIFTTKRLTL
jgi:hypothetical protein